MHASLVCDVNELNLYISVDLDLCYHRPITLLAILEVMPSIQLQALKYRGYHGSTVLW